MGAGATSQAASYAYTLGNAGNRMAVSELGGRNVAYQYDNLYRLTQETIAGAVSQNGTIAYTHDAVGNHTPASRRRCRHAQPDRLRAGDRRERRRQCRAALHLGLQLISKLETQNSQLSFYGFDGHGSVRQMFDSTGNVTDTCTYDAFGNVLSQTGSTPNVYMFAGEAFDQALGVYYNRARYLNTQTGRFWSMDAADGYYDAPASFHKYLYTGDEPTDRADPTGNDFDPNLRRGDELSR